MSNSNPSNSNTTRTVKPEVDELPGEFTQLERAVAALPHEQRDKIQPLFNQVAEASRRRRRILTLVQEALSQLRLDMKYMMFDLEATRRERNEYKRQLEDNES